MVIQSSSLTLQKEVLKGVLEIAPVTKEGITVEI
jgi:hypothetical protein